MDAETRKRDELPRGVRTDHQAQHRGDLEVVALLVQQPGALDLRDRGADLLGEAGLVGRGGAAVGGQRLLDLRLGDDGALASGGLGEQHLAQHEQQHRVEPVHAGQAAQELGRVGVVLALAHEGDLGVVVDDQLEEEIGEPRLDRGAVAQQLGVAGTVAPPVEEGALEQVHEHPAGVVHERAAGHGRTRLLARGEVVGIGAVRRTGNGDPAYRRSPVAGGRSGPGAGI